MKGYIYKITNKVNGMSYIGQTRFTVESRWRQHIKAKDNVQIHVALQKYGSDNFTVETLEECEVSDLDSREIFYISKFDTFKNGYNMTKGGSAYNPHRRYANGYIVVDSKYDEIKNLYLSGFSTSKISTLYDVDRHVIANILKSMGIKLQHNVLNINNVEFQELVRDYKSGYSLKQLAKRYGCTPVGLKDFLIRKGVDLEDKYSILNDQQGQINLINDYLGSTLKLAEIQAKYHCSYSTFKKVLSLHGIKQKGLGGKFKLNETECLEVIKQFNDGIKVKQIAENFKVDKCTIYAVFKRYHVNYLTI